jgi:hypothetical protein
LLSEFIRASTVPQIRFLRQDGCHTSDGSGVIASESANTPPVVYLIADSTNLSLYPAGIANISIPPSIAPIVLKFYIIVPGNGLVGK